MKKVLILCFVSLTLISCHKDREDSPFDINNNGDLISLEQARIIMSDVLSNVDFAYMYDNIIPANTTFSVYDLKSKIHVDKKSPGYDSWLFVVNPFYLSDRIPTFWDYYYVNAFSGKIEHLRHQSAPDDYSGEWFSLNHITLLVGGEVSHETKSGEERELLRGFNPQPVTTYSGHTYAIIIDGGVNQSNNHMRYWNMCQFLYRTLKLKYGLNDDDIYTLICGGPSPTWYFSNGYACTNYKDFDFDGIDDIDYSATTSNIDTVFDDIADLAIAGDNLLIFVTDHGDYDYSSSICLWGWENYYPDDLYDQILKIDSGVRIHMVLGQCYSGGFYPTITRSNVSLTTSCLASESAHVLYGDSTYSEFLYHWICAMAGMTPSGNTIDADSNDDGFVSYYEAFVYARDHDYYHLYCSGNDTETPQYHNFTLYFGENHDIVGNHCYVPRFFTVSSGIDVSYNTSETLTVTDVPPGATPVFYVSSNLSIVSYGNNYVTFKYAGSQPAAEGNIVGFNVYKNNAHYNWHKDNITGWRGGVYNGQNNIELSYGGNPARFALPLLFQNCNSFSWSSSVPSWYPLVQDYYAYFNTDDILPGVGDTVTVSFYNPLGEYTVISEVLSDMGYDIDYQ